MRWCVDMYVSRVLVSPLSSGISLSCVIRSKGYKTAVRAFDGLFQKKVAPQSAQPSGGRSASRASRRSPITCGYVCIVRKSAIYLFLLPNAKRLKPSRCFSAIRKQVSRPFHVLTLRRSQQQQKSARAGLAESALQEPSAEPPTTAPTAERAARRAEP